MVTAFFGFVLTLNTFQNLKKSRSGIMVITAARDLDLGDTLGEKDVLLVAAPTGTDLSLAYREIGKVVGKTVRNPTRRGQVISNFDLLNENDNLSGLIPAGYRASTIPISLPKETLGNLKFGSRVDILYADTSEKQFGTKTIMKNILVLKVFANQGAPTPGVMPGQAYLTLAIRPEAAETLAYAGRKGKIDISVRPNTDHNNTTEEYMSLNEILGFNKDTAVSPTAYQSAIEVIRGIKKTTVRL